VERPSEKGGLFNWVGRKSVELDRRCKIDYPED